MRHEDPSFSNCTWTPDITTQPSSSTYHPYIISRGKGSSRGAVVDALDFPIANMSLILTAVFNEGFWFKVL